jgi:hypothetical protein
MSELNKETPVVEEETKETPVEPTTPVEKDPLDELIPGAEPIAKYTNEKPFNEVVEDARLAFNKDYNKSRKISYIVMGIVLVVAIAAVILVTMENMALRIVGWGLVVIAIGVMIAYYIANRNKMPVLTQDYIKKVNETLNSYTFSDDNISEASVDSKEKIEVSEVNNDGIYKEIGNIASRNVVKGKYLNRSFVAADLGLYNKETGRKQRSYFVGKYLSLSNDLHFTDRYILCSFGKEAVDLPTDLEGLDAIISEDNFIIYGKPGTKPEKDLGKDFIKAIKNIALDETLLGLSVVVWAGRTLGYFSYSDEIMTLPFQSEFTGKANKKYKEDTIDALKAFSTLE